MKNKALIFFISLILSFSIVCFSACKIDEKPSISLTPTPSISAPPTPLATITPTPTPSLVPSPTPTFNWNFPTDNNNGNGNVNGNGNDNSGGDLFPPNTEIIPTIDQLAFQGQYKNVDDKRILTGFSIFGFNPNVTAETKNSFTQIIIPETYTDPETSETAPVKYVDGFCDLANIIDVVLPDTLETIGSWAFSNCAKLQYVSAPRSLKSIEVSAFEDCTALEFLPIVDSFTEFDAKSFKNTAWYVSKDDGLINLNNVCIGVKGEIPTEINITADTIKIAPNAFKMERNLVSPITTVNFNDNLKIIGSSGFDSCKNLVAINFSPNSTLVNIESFAFYMTALEHITLPQSLRSIGNFAFAYCDKLQSINCVDNANSLPQNVSHIGMSAFAFCTNLSNLTIPNSVVKVGEMAFQNWTATQAISIVGYTIDTLPYKADIPKDKTLAQYFGCDCQIIYK